MHEQSDSLLQYPCEIAVKAMGRHAPDLQDLVVAIVARHVGAVLPAQVSVRPSRNGNFLSVTVKVMAQSREQMDQLYRELTAHERIDIAL